MPLLPKPSENPIVNKEPAVRSHLVLKMEISPCRATYRLQNFSKQHRPHHHQPAERAGTLEEIRVLSGEENRGGREGLMVPTNSSMYQQAIGQFFQWVSFFQGYDLAVPNNQWQMQCSYSGCSNRVKLLKGTSSCSFDIPVRTKTLIRGNTQSPWHSAHNTRGISFVMHLSNPITLEFPTLTTPSVARIHREKNSLKKPYKKQVLPQWHCCSICKNTRRILLDLFSQ